MHTTCGKTAAKSDQPRWPGWKLVPAFALALALVALGAGEGGQPVRPENPAPAVVDRGRDYRVWERVTYERAASGKLVARRHRYTELATGLHFKRGNKWVDSREEVALAPQGGAEATHGPHQVFFPPDIYNGFIELMTEEGTRLRSRPLGISYADGSNSVLIAELKNSIGQLLPSGNQVIYPNAFTDIDADLVCTYRKSGFECDLVFRQRPPAPEEFGFDPETTWIQLLTEFVDTPEPRKKSRSTKKQDDPDDADLEFGTMTMVRGKAFDVGETARGESVHKTWTTLEGRTFLIEQLPLKKLDSRMRKLPGPGAQTPQAVPANSVRRRVSATRLLPPGRLVQASTNMIQTAQARLDNRPGVVLDYVIISGDTNDYTFQAGATYYITGPVYVSGTTTLEDGTVIKYAPGVGAKLSVTTLISPSASPAILTARDDDTVGEMIAESTHTPTSGYAEKALEINFDGDNWVSNITIRHATYGLYYLPIYSGSTTHYVNNVDIRHGNAGIYAEGDAQIATLAVCCSRISHVSTALDGYCWQGSADQLIVSYANSLANDGLYAEYILTIQNSTLAEVDCLACYGIIVVDNGNNGYYEAPEFGSLLNLHPPSASSFSISTPLNTAANITLSATDPDNDPLTFRVDGGPAHGTLSGSGTSRVYTPTNGFEGYDAFTYRADDGILESAAATVTITVGLPDGDLDGISDAEELYDGTNPTNALSVAPVRLGSWRFDATNWIGLQGQLPLSFTNLGLVSGLSSNAVRIDTNLTAGLAYREREPGFSIRNITFGRGSIRFWFRPSWSTSAANSPSNQAPLIEAGAKNSTGWWGLMLGPSGTNIAFCTQTNSGAVNTNFLVPIQWPSNQWRQVVLTYSATNSSLYVDGQAVKTNGAGVTVLPPPDVRAQGFHLGSVTGGTNQAKGYFENLETFNFVLSATNIANEYTTPCYPAVDVVLVVDRSGSMEGTMNNVSRLTAAKMAATNFVMNLNTNTDQAGIVYFSTSPSTPHLDLTNKLAVWKQYIGSIPGPHEWTDMSNALWTARNTVTNRHNPEALPVIVFLTDGAPTDIRNGSVVDNPATSNLVYWTAQNVKSEGIRLITVALGNDSGLNTNLMRLMATTTNDFYHATSTNALNGAYDSIAASLCRGTNAAPSVQIISPINNEFFNVSPTIPIRATATDPENALVRVTFYAGSTYLGQDYYGSNNVFQITWTNAASGIHALTAVAWDEFGLSTTSAVVTIKINAGPTVNAGADQLLPLPDSQTTLTGSYTDDGLPVGATLASQWSVVSSNGPVVFGNVDVTNTTAYFTNAGIYVLKLTANDTLATNSDTVTISVNQKPQVGAVPYQILPLFGSSVATGLGGSVSDDGLPTGAPVTAVWSVVAATNGTVVFANSNSPTTTATFTNVGFYFLRLTANDTVSTNSFDVTIQINRVPVVNAGPDQTLMWVEGSSNITANLQGMVTDDGFGNPPGYLGITWSKIIGPGNVTFTPDPSATNATASFTTNGTYILRLHASDGGGPHVFDYCTITIQRRPFITITAPTNNAAFNFGAPITTVASVYDVFGSVTNVQFQNFGTNLGTGTGVGTITNRVSWWRAESNAVDHVGTNHGTPSALSYTQGIAGLAFKFVANINRVLIEDGPGLKLTNSLTIEGWVRPTANGRTIFMRGDNRSGWDPYVMEMLNNTNLAFRITKSDGTSVSLTNGLVYNQWSHIAGTLNDSDGAMKLYVNGALVKQTITTARPFGDLQANQSPGLEIGNSRGFILPFVGHIDEVALYSRALSASEILSLYQAGTNNSYDIFTFVWTNAPVGSNSLTGIATDNEGVTRTSAPPVNVIVRSPMSVSLTQPAANAIFTAPATVPLSATVVNGINVQRVEFFNSASSSPIGQDSVSSANPYTFTWVGVVPGSYTLTAKVTDAYGTATSAGVPITVSNPIDVNPGTNRIVVLTNGTATIGLTGSYTGGYGTITSLWTQLTGPAPVAFANATSTNTAVTFTNTGSYLLLLTAGNSYSWDSGVVTVSVYNNQPPTVSAGPNRIIELGSAAFLNGSVTDDGLPRPPSLSNWWSVVSPTNVTLTFSNINAAITTVTNFPAHGVYTLRLNATDGMATNSNDVTVSVVPAGSRTYTFDADFAEGELVNVNFDEIPNQLQLNQKITPFPFVWVACSGRNTMVRIDANTGEILGEYHTAPQTIAALWSVNYPKPDPSRTTVDRYGNAWVANRGDDTIPDTTINKGTIARVGIVIGGTRGTLVGGNFVENPTGEYLKPPFKYCTAVDRNNDGYIRTSRGVGNVLDWDASQTHTNDAGGVSLADDECIINYTRVQPRGVRTIAIDANNDLWVGGYIGNTHEKISGVTGQPIPNTAFLPNLGGYGGLIDGKGVLWSAKNLFRFDISRRFDMTVNPPAIIDPSYVGEPISANSYGIGIDPKTGDIWTAYAGGCDRINPVDLSISVFNWNMAGVYGRGIAVDDDENVWIADSALEGTPGVTVAHGRTDGSYVGQVQLGCENSAPTGVAIDSNGKIWVTCMSSDTVVRIDPRKGPRMLDNVLNPDGYPLGEVDLVVKLAPTGSGLGPAGPYNYSDMTGFISLGATEPAGIWGTVHDSGITNQSWNIVKWSSSEPVGSHINVEVRAANDYLQLTATNNLFQPVTNGVAFSNVTGRFVEIRTRLSHKQGIEVTPVLYDLTISSGTNAVVATPAGFANSDHATMLKNAGAKTINVLSNDVAPAGATLAITKVSPASSGSVRIGTGNTNVIYTPNTNFFGTDRFVYTVTDNQGGISRAVVTVEVGNVLPAPALTYRAPIAADTNIVVRGNSPEVFIDMLPACRDTNTPPLATNIISVGQAGHGVVRIANCGIFYRPNPGYVGPDQFTYTIRNSKGLTDTGTVTITVTGGWPVKSIACGVSTNGTFTTNNSAISLRYSDPPNLYLAHSYIFAGNPTNWSVIDVTSSAQANLRLYDHTGKDITPNQSTTQIVYLPRTTNLLTVDVVLPTYQSLGSGINYTLSHSCSNAPEGQIAVYRGTTNLLHGSTLDFGVTQVGTPVSIDLTVTNYGSQELTLHPITALDPNDGTFTLTNSIIGQGYYVYIPPHSSSNLTVRFEALRPGQGSNFITLFATGFDYQLSAIAWANPTNTVAPTVAITSPASNSVYAVYKTIPDCSPYTAVNITVEASAAAGYTVQGVDVYARAANGTTIPLGPGQYAGPGQYSVEWTNAPVGLYDLTAIATDDGGLQNVSVPVPIEVVLRTSSSPVMKVLLSGTEVPDLSTVNLGIVPAGTQVDTSFVITNASANTLNISAISLANSGYPNAFYLTNLPSLPLAISANSSTTVTVVFYVSGGAYCPACTNALQITTDDEGIFNACPVGEMEIRLAAVGSDPGSGPAISITNPLANTTFAYPATISLVATTAVTGMGNVHFYASSSAGGNAYLGGGTALGGGVYRFDWSGALPGSYSLTAVAIDNGNRASISSAVPITIALRPTPSPIMQVYLFQTNLLANGTTVHSGLTPVGTPVISSFTISNAGDADLLISKLTLLTTNTSSDEFSVGGIDIPAIVPAGGTTNLAVTYHALDLGEVTSVLNIYANDHGAALFVITNIGRAKPIVTTPPTVHFVSPANGARFAFPSDVPITATANCPTNTTLRSIDFYTTADTGKSLIGQVLADPGLTNLTGTFDWPSPDPGTYSILAIAVDRSGLMGLSTTQLVVHVIDPDAGSTNPPAANAPPIARDDTVFIVGCVSNCTVRPINVLANDTDPNNDRIELTSFIYTGHLGRISQEGNRLLFTPHPLMYGTNVIYYTITDGQGGTAAAWVTIYVTQASLPIVELITPLDGQYIELPTEVTNRNLVLSAFALATNPGGSIARVNFYDQEQLLGYATTTNNSGPYTGLYTYTWRTPPAGVHLITAIALDNVGQENITPAAYIEIAGNPNNTPPIAVITNLAPAVSNVNGMLIEVYPFVTEGRLDVRGHARDTNAGDVVSYQVQLRKPDGTLVADITPTSNMTNGFHYGTDVAGVLVTNVDLSLYENGVYDVVLNVFDGWEISSDTARILLNSQLKIGQFTFSVKDLAIPVGGIPLTVIRTYNSLNLRSGDFGYSWTYSINDVQLELDEVREETPDIDATEGRFSLRMGGGRDVTLTLPDGQRVTYQFYFDGPKECEENNELSQFCYEAKWKAPPGVYYELTGLQPYVYNGVSGYWNNQTGTGFENYDFAGFILTSPDGTQCIIRRDDEGDHFFDSGYNSDYYAHTYGEARLTEIIQRDGNRLVIDGDHMQHYDPAGQPTRSIRFQRDDQDRIVAIRDPNSGSDGLPVMKYVYHKDTGNLIETHKLTDRNANGGLGAYQSTFYHYTNTHFPHFITDIIDPRGVKVAKTFYDESGRIIGMEDANGKLTQIIHNLDGRIGIVVDRLGNTNTMVYDARGNVTAQTNALGEWMLNSYDDSGNVTATVDALGNTNRFVYDAQGNQTQAVDALNRTNFFVYDDYGNLLSQKDPLGNVSSNRYDSFGNPTNTIQLDSSGNVIEQSFSKYENGRVIEARNGNNQVIASLDHDSLGNPTNTTDARGFSREFGYDANGNRTNTSYTWTPPGGSPTDVTATTLFDSAGRVIQTTDPLGNTNRTFYNSLGKVDYTIDKFGNTQSFIYDARGNVIQTTYADGLYTRTVYDDNARPVLSTDRNGVTGTRTEYDAASRVIRTIRLTDVAISITPVNGVPQSSIGSAGVPFSTNSTEYLPNGWVKFRTGPDGQKTSYAYWPDGETKYVTNALNEVTYFEYDEAGRQKLVRDALNRESQFQYDAVGRTTKTIFADGTFTTNIFNNLGKRIGTKDQAGLLTQFGYDVSGTLTNVTKPQVPDPENENNLVSPQWAYVYDQYGKQTSMIDPKGRSTTNTYDALGRQIGVRLPMGEVSSNVFNAKGQLWKQYDFQGQWTTAVYDNFGRLKAKFLFNNGASYPSNAVCYSYNTLGQLARITERYGADASTNTCDGYFALVGKPAGDSKFAVALALGIKASPPLLAFVAFCSVMIFVPAGRKLRQAFTAFYLRGGWRIAGVHASACSWKRRWMPSYWLRGIAVLVLVALIGSDEHLDDLWTTRAQCNIPSNFSTETTRITEFTHDFDGRPVQVNTPEGVINYAYDLATGRHIRTCTANSETHYGYDELGRLKTVTQTKRNGVAISAEQTAYTYTPIGSRASMTLPNGIVTSYTYDDVNRLTNMTHQASTTNLATYRYLVDATGRRTNAVEILRQENDTYLTNTLTWKYDAMHRLTNELSSSSSSSGSYTNTFVYDKVGNRLKQIRITSATTTITNEFNANDQLLKEVTELNSTLSTNLYAYDPNGSLTSKTSGGTVTSYTYNLANKLSAVAVGGIVQASYQYNDQGIRVRANTGSTKYYLIDANNHTGFQQVLEEFSTLGSAPTISYVLGDDVLGQCGTTTSDPRWLLYDGHGNTRQLARPDKTVSSRYNYDAFGMTLGSSSTTAESAPTSLLYCGEQYDSTLKMYNLRARYYDPDNGRFNARDTYQGNNSDPQSLHKYAYCPDPVNLIDPSGHTNLTEAMIVGFFIFVLVGIGGFLGGISKRKSAIRGMVAGLMLGFGVVFSLGNSCAPAAATAGGIAALVISIIDCVYSVATGDTYALVDIVADAFEAFAWGYFKASFGDISAALQMTVLILAGLISLVTNVIDSMYMNKDVEQHFIKDLAGLVLDGIILAVINSMKNPVPGAAILPPKMMDEAVEKVSASAGNQMDIIKVANLARKAIVESVKKIFQMKQEKYEQSEPMNGTLI